MKQITMNPHELVGTLFTTPKELRHLAERQFGQLFVPTEVITNGAQRAAIALCLSTHGRIVVHADRERHWYPYRVTRVETSRASIATEGLRIAV